MTSTAATRISHDQQPRRSDMDEHQREEYLRIAYRAAGQDVARHQRGGAPPLARRPGSRLRPRPGRRARGTRRGGPGR